MIDLFNIQSAGNIFPFQIWLTSSIYSRFTDQLKSRGKVTQTKIFMEPYLDLKVLATSMVPYVIYSDEYRFKFFVSRKRTTFITLEDYENAIQHDEFITSNRTI